jgi:hypothetical protein
MCAAPSKWCLRDITDVSRDLCDDYVPPADFMSIDAWAKLTDQEKEEWCAENYDFHDLKVSAITSQHVAPSRVVLVQLLINLCVNCS